MFIESLDEQYPKRVLKSIRLTYEGFQVVFDLPQQRYLEITIHAFAKEDHILVFELLKGTESGRYWLIDSRRHAVIGDILPLLESYLRTTIGGIEHGYEGSFAEMILASIRCEQPERGK